MSLSGVLQGDDVVPDASAATASFADPGVAAQKAVTVVGLALAELMGATTLWRPYPFRRASCPLLCS